MDEQRLYFVYRDSKKNVTGREVVDVVSKDGYLQAYCKSAEALRTFREDRILEFAKNREDLSEKLDYHLKNSPNRTNLPLQKRNRDMEHEVLFTGFAKDRKNELIDIAKAEGFYIPSKVTNNLYILCVGKNAGPSKVKNAREQNVFILTEQQFLSFIETGEIAEI